MNAQQKTTYAELEASGRMNRIIYRVTGLLGLTTGIGVIAWGIWSLVTTAATFVYEETGVSTVEVLINNGLNEGLLLSSIVIALGVIILELKKIQHILVQAADPSADDSSD